MRILYNFATRSRPEQFMETMDSIINMSEATDYFFAIKLDFDDVSLSDYSYCLQGFPKPFTIAVGSSTSKIHAINRDIPTTPWDILVNVSDDFIFTAPGFDQTIRHEFRNNLPYLDKFVHFPDQLAGERLCTMSVIGRKYYERDGYVYHPDYYSLWCDNEAQDVAKMRGCYLYAPNQIFTHQHYSAGLSAKDPLYRRNDTYHADREIYEARKARNFDL